MSSAEINISCAFSPKKDSVRSLPVYVDISFTVDAKAPPLEAIVFQNYYVYSITVVQFTKGSTEVCVLENKILMKQAYSETGAQQSFFIHVSELNDYYVEGLPLRLYLFQPSCLWNLYEIRHIRAVSKSAPQNVSLSEYYVRNSIQNNHTATIMGEMRTLARRAYLRSSLKSNGNQQSPGVHETDGRKASAKADIRKKRKE